MINWNDIRVEQEIAQERYQPIIQARQMSRALAKSEGRSKTNFYHRFFAWVGNKVEDLGVNGRGPQKSVSSQC